MLRNVKDWRTSLAGSLVGVLSLMTQYDDLAFFEPYRLYVSVLGAILFIILFFLSSSSAIDNFDKLNDLFSKDNGTKDKSNDDNENGLLGPQSRKLEGDIIPRNKRRDKIKTSILKKMVWKINMPVLVLFLLATSSFAQSEEDFSGSWPTSQVTVIQKESTSIPSKGNYSVIVVPGVYNPSSRVRSYLTSRVNDGTPLQTMTIRQNVYHKTIETQRFSSFKISPRKEDLPYNISLNRPDTVSVIQHENVPDWEFFDMNTIGAFSPSRADAYRTTLTGIKGRTTVSFNLPLSPAAVVNGAHLNLLPLGSEIGRVSYSDTPSLASLPIATGEIFHPYTAIISNGVGSGVHMSPRITYHSNLNRDPANDLAVQGTSNEHMQMNLRYYGIGKPGKSTRYHNKSDIYPVDLTVQPDVSIGYISYHIAHKGTDELGKWLDIAVRSSGSPYYQPLTSTIRLREGDFDRDFVRVSIVFESRMQDVIFLASATYNGVPSSGHPYLAIAPTNYSANADANSEGVMIHLQPKVTRRSREVPISGTDGTLPYHRSLIINTF